jgi:hypothetical protein
MRSDEKKKHQQVDSNESRIPQQDRIPQEANAVSRKTTGIHNWTDRKIPSRKAADVGKVDHPKRVVKVFAFWWKS